MTEWHILPGLKIDVLIACRRLSVSPQNVECVLRYSASGQLQKFAADLTYLHPKITAMQNCHIIAKQQSKSTSTFTLNSSFVSDSLKKLSLSYQKVFMQHFDLNSDYCILIRTFCMLKLISSALRFHLSSQSSPFCVARSRLKNQPQSTLLSSRPPSSRTGSGCTRHKKFSRQFFFIIGISHAFSCS